MKNSQLCQICYEGFEHELNLISISLNKMVEEFPKELTIGVSLSISEIDALQNNNLKLGILFRLFGTEIHENKSPIVQESDSESLYFEIVLEYEIILNMNEDCCINIEDEKSDKAIKDYAWFLAYPTIKELVNNLTNRINLPNLNIPFETRGSKNENTN